MIRIAMIFLGSLILASMGHAGSPAPITLTPFAGEHQFPFFDTPTPVWSYNGRIPGPLIRAVEGQQLIVEVVNRLDEPTSVHWHGLRIDNAMDGVPGVTQEPIAPGKRFTYRLDLQEAGTFWYHPHLNAGEQLERGLKGVLIVEERDPLPWSQDLVWLLDDWRLRRDGTIFPYFNTPHDLMHDGRWGNAITVNGQVQPDVFVRPGERIRLRLINGANARIFAPVLAGLKPRVIAVDGRPVSKTVLLEEMVLSPGNRIDLDLTIPADATGETYSVQDLFTRNTLLLGKIRVKQAKAVATPRFDTPLTRGFLEAKRFDDLAVSKTWDLDAMRAGPFGIGWSMNRRLWPEADRASLPIGQPVKIRFANSSTRLHPMHIHGAFFRVLSVNGRPAMEPFTRDTVLVGPKESITIGLIPEHPGIWLAHCHIQSHADAGMMTTITVK